MHQNKHFETQKLKKKSLAGDSSSFPNLSASSHISPPSPILSAPPVSDQMSVNTTMVPSRPVRAQSDSCTLPVDEGSVDVVKCN